MLHYISGSIITNPQKPIESFSWNKLHKVVLKAWKLDGASKLGDIGPSYPLLTSRIEIKK